MEWKYECLSMRTFRFFVAFSLTQVESTEWTDRGGSSTPTTDPNNHLRGSKKAHEAARSQPVFLVEKLTEWILSDVVFLFFFSPPCLPTDILSFNSSAAWRAMEGAWERVGGRREGWREKESLFWHQKTVSETRGNTLTLRCAFWWCLSALWTQWYTTAAAVY